MLAAHFFLELEVAEVAGEDAAGGAEDHAEEEDDSGGDDDESTRGEIGIKGRDGGSEPTGNRSDNGG